MDTEDWKRLEELVIQAGAAIRSKQLTEMQAADAMSFHTLGIAVLDIHSRLAKLNPATNKPVLITSPYGN
jgi:hypothetical protein